ncbi:MULTISPECIES: ABC transporter substrate-binding protein [unclassified Afipia]|uniref:ABC transporter substrate-binding protein n=1 Tax=unclassified Afipia TaxID=2642050 RepID=UPI000413024F|nr:MULTISPECIES: ABC transporter substrate-binding protein [unclassified Afipia]
MLKIRTFVTAVAMVASSAVLAQDPAPLKIGAILDMSGLYADITGDGSVKAAQMAIDDFGGEVLGRKVELLSADHLNKADIAGATAREWFDNQGVEALVDVAASATALAANEVARSRKKIIMLSGPGAVTLTNEACSPYTVHYNYDTCALSHGTALAALKQGYNTWFFLTADYAFGSDLEKDASAVVIDGGGKIVGRVRHPLNTADFSSFLLQAQASKAKVIGLANAGGDTINAIKQAAEFGITKNQKLVALLAFITDIESLSLQTSQGLLVTEAFYWDMNDETRAFSKRFEAKIGRKPTSAQASIYSSVLTYLNAVKKAGATNSDAVMVEMKRVRINHMFAKNGYIREDGRMIHDMYLFEVKSPSDSKGKWDNYKLLETIPGDQAFQPLSLSRCPLVKK